MRAHTNSHPQKVRDREIERERLRQRKKRKRHTQRQTQGQRIKKKTDHEVFKHPQISPNISCFQRDFYVEWENFSAPTGSKICIQKYKHFYIFLCFCNNFCLSAFFKWKISQKSFRFLSNSLPNVFKVSEVQNNMPPFWLSIFILLIFFLLITALSFLLKLYSTFFHFHLEFS